MLACGLSVLCPPSYLHLSVKRDEGGGKCANNRISFHPFPLPLAASRKHGGLRTPVLVIFEIW